MDIEKSYVGKAKENIRISGFLEKKGKMVITFKKLIIFLDSIGVVFEGIYIDNKH